MKLFVAKVCLTLAIGAGCVSLIWFCFRVTQPRVVARAVAPDGTLYCIVQEFNWSAEPFTTSVYYRRPGRPWGWLYYDHQDLYWGSGSIAVDPKLKRISVDRGGQVTVTFDWETERFRLLRDNPCRDIVGAQEWKEPPIHPWLTLP